MKSRKSIINSDFWMNKWIQTLTPSEGLFYIHLFTNVNCNIAGVYKTSIIELSRIFQFDIDKTTTVLRKFEKAGKAYYKNGYIILPNQPNKSCWKSSSIKTKKGIVKILKKLDEKTLKILSDCKYKFDLSLVDKLVIASDLRKRISKKIKNQIRVMYKNRCLICGDEFSLEIHHVKSVLDGGKNNINNLILVCSKCHKTIHKRKDNT